MEPQNQQQTQQQNFNQLPPQGQQQNAGAIRPPHSNPTNMTRPPMPPTSMRHPPMPMPPGMRPPPLVQQGQRPPMPQGMRPPPPPSSQGQHQSAAAPGSMRPQFPPPQHPQMASSVNLPRPMAPPVPQSSSHNLINGFNNQPPTIPSPSLRIRPPMPSTSMPTAQPTAPFVQSTPPTIPPMPMRPSIPSQSPSQIPLVKSPNRPPMPVPTQSAVSPGQSTVRPLMPIPGQSRPPMASPVQNPNRPPMPMMTPPTGPPVRPPIPSGPPIPGMSAQRPPGPPLPGHPMSPSAPKSPILTAPPKPMIPQMTQAPIAQTQPQMAGYLPTGYSQTQPQNQVPVQPSRGYHVNPQSYQAQAPNFQTQSQPHIQTQSQLNGQNQVHPLIQTQNQPQSHLHGQPQSQQPVGYGQQNSYNSGFSQGPAPQAVNSSSHNLKDFYEEQENLIKPNIKPEYFSCSLEKIPRNAGLLGKARTPFGLTVSFYPFGDAEKDRVAEVNGPIVRCRRCRTYLNPFCELIEQGSRWRCNMCFLANEFPQNYDFDQATQASIERKEHVELKNFVYDFTNAPIEYTVRPPQPPVFFFALEVTAAAVHSGLFAASCRVIQEQLDSIPNEDGRARVALVTFDQRIQFYKVTPTEPNAQVLVVADAGEPFLPAFSDLLVNLSECRSQLDTLLDQLPQMYATPSKSSPALGPVLQSAHMLLKSVGGKIVVICASLPTQFEGALKARDDQKLLGTPKESSLFQPANQFYKLFASEVVKDQICVDLFVAPPQLTTQVPIYVDLASLSGLTKYTGGKLHYYPEFGVSEAITSKFCSDLRRFLGQAHGFEAVLRIRASQGISLSAYHGSFFLRQTDLLSLPNVNPDHSFSAQASIDENLQGTVICFQAALLHTTARGERRIRVINFSAPITDDVKDIFNNMNVKGIAGILSKMAVEKVLANRLEDAREAVLNKCSDVIAAYKNQNGLKSNPNLLLPENMKNFPIMLHALIKSFFLRSGSNNLPDFRAYYLTLLKTLSVPEIVGLLLPRFYAIHSMESDVGLNGKLPDLLNLSAEKLERHGIFLLDNGFQQFLWIGSNVHPELLSMLFGTAQIPSGRTSSLLPDLENDWNSRLKAISETLRSTYSKNRQPEYFIVKEESEIGVRQLFMSNLIEDRSVDGSSPSYAQWLMEVQSRVNSASY